MPTTHLAAIMFTDIVGYTAMMQTDQAQAMAAVKDYEAVLRERIAHHKGELIQTYGDGSLSIFDSASSAVQCAQEIQEQIRESVPLRIGIHLGEVTRDGEHTFGDGVNIASRIESMGVAGAVLLSSSVRQQIKNKPEFELASLGEFSFKNVAEPMTVYALANEGFAVPKREEIKGKLKQEEGTKQTRIKINHLILGLIIAGVFGYLGWGLSQNGVSEPTEKEQVIAVLPFRDLSKKQDQEYFCDGVAEELLNALAKLKGLTVRGRASSFSFKGQGLGLNEIASKLGATVLLDGSIRKDGDKIRVSVQLLDGVTESPIWSNQYDRSSGDIFVVQEEIAREVINNLQITLLPGESETLLAAQTHNPLAHELYLKGVHALNAGARKSDEALGHLEQAIGMDSTYYSALVELSVAYRAKGLYGGGASYFEKSKWAAERAIALNASFPEAYIELVEYCMLYSQDLVQGDHYYNEAVKRGYREPNATHAILLLVKQKYDQAIAEAEAILANNPFSVMEKTNLSRVNLWSGNYARTLEVTEKTLAEYPVQSSAMRHRGDAFLMLGKNEEALEVFEKLSAVKGYADYGRVIALNRVGKEKESQLAFQQTRHLMVETEQASCFVEYQQIDSAFFYLEKGIRKKNGAALIIPSQGLLKPLHGDPRYKALLRQMGLSE